MNINEITHQAGVTGPGRRRVGRGIGSHGKTSGRGHKGESSRSGAKDYSMKEGGQMPFFRKVAKRGFNTSGLATSKSVAVVDVAKIGSLAVDNDVIDIDVLKRICVVSGDAKSIRVIGNRAVTRSFKLTASHVSRAASASIEKAGGVVVLV